MNEIFIRQIFICLPSIMYTIRLSAHLDCLFKAQAWVYSVSNRRDIVSGTGDSLMRTGDDVLQHSQFSIPLFKITPHAHAASPVLPYRNNRRI